MHVIKLPSETRYLGFRYLDIFVLFMSCVCHAFVSVHCCLVEPAGKGLTSWFLFVMFNCVFVTFPCGILGQVWWYLIASIPDLCRLSYF